MLPFVCFFRYARLECLKVCVAARSYVFCAWLRLRTFYFEEGTMKETLRELYDREIASYEADFWEPEEKENVDNLIREQHDKIFYTLDFDDKVTLIKLENATSSSPLKSKKTPLLRASLLL